MKMRTRIIKEIRRSTPNLHSLLNRTNRQLQYHRRRLHRRQYEFFCEANEHLRINEFGWVVVEV
jgi:transposase